MNDIEDSCDYFEKCKGPILNLETTPVPVQNRNWSNSGQTAWYLEIAQTLSSASKNLAHEKNFPFRLNDLFKFICDCSENLYKCNIYEQVIEQNLIYNHDLRIAIMVLYIIIMTAALSVNLLLVFILSKQCYPVSKLLRSCNKKVTTSTPKQAVQHNTLNSYTNVLLVSLILGHFLIISYVMPRQIYMFYTGISPNGVDCKVTEFIKAFAVSLTVYSLAAISVQSLYTVKFYSSKPSQNKFVKLSESLLNTQLVKALFNYFIENVKTLVKILLSVFYYKWFVTTVLCTLVWLSAILTGYFNMTRYMEKYIIHKNYNYLKNNEPFKCEFKDVSEDRYEYCGTSESQNDNRADIAFFITLLIVPNLIIFPSYAYICYHIWSNSRNLLKTVDNNKKDDTKIASSKVLIKDNKRIETIQDIKVESVSKQTHNIERSIVIKNTTKNANMLLTAPIVKFNNNNNNNNNKTASSTYIASDYNTQYTNSTTLATTTGYPTNHHNLKSIRKRNKTVTLTVCLMALCFTFCWFPFFTFPLFYTKITDSILFINVKVAIHLIGYSSALWNPIIYIVKIENFNFNSLKPVKTLCCCCFLNIKIMLIRICSLIRCKKMMSCQKQTANKVDCIHVQEYQLENSVTNF